MNKMKNIIHKMILNNSIKHLHAIKELYPVESAEKTLEYYIRIDELLYLHRMATLLSFRQQKLGLITYEYKYKKESIE